MFSKMSLLFLSLAIMFSLAFAQIPQKISYQGILTDAGGALVPNSTYNLAFRIYNVASGGTALWTENQSVQTTDGLFNVNLGENTALALSFDAPYWLGITIDAGTELSPRVELTSAGYSLNANSVVDNAITTAKIVDGAVTQAKLAPGMSLPPGGVAGGDLSGTYPNPMVAGIQSRTVLATAPASGEVLKWNGSSWAPAADNAGTSVWNTSGNHIYNANPGNVGVGTMNPLMPLHVGSGSERTQVLLSPVSTSSGDSSEIFFAEDTDGTYGMYLLYDGSGNDLEFWGKSVSSLYGPHVEIDRTSGFTQFHGDLGPITVVHDSLYAGHFTSTYLNSNTVVIHAEVVGTGTNVDATGVYGYSRPVDNYGIGGSFVGGFRGVYGFSNGGTSVGTGVRGNGTSTTSNAYGVYGTASGGTSGTRYGVYGTASGGSTAWAGFFNGAVNVTGVLSKGGGSFKIDHPLDPENKYLYHSFVESPDMMNIYNGNVALDGNGEAWVEMPVWFDAVNRDFRYQLTAIGAPGPNLYIAEEIFGNRFKIAGGTAGMKVSWQVTGIRHDPFANANRIPVEEMKPADQRGKYLHPTAYGQSESRGLHYEEEQEALRREAAARAASRSNKKRIAPPKADEVDY